MSDGDPMKGPMEGGRGLGWEWGGFAGSMEGAAAAKYGGEGGAFGRGVGGGGRCE